jgi:hypothetical protein
MYKYSNYNFMFHDSENSVSTFGTTAYGWLLWV